MTILTEFPGFSYPKGANDRTIWINPNCVAAVYLVTYDNGLECTGISMASDGGIFNIALPLKEVVNRLADEQKGWFVSKAERRKEKET